MLYSIQALRGAGAIAVVIFHALTLYPAINFRAGAAGVDLFFVISGIVMALSIKENTDPRIFFIRRVIRVVPLYWLMTLFAVLNVYIFYPGASVSAEGILRSIFFLRPENGSMPILYPGWSLNYEMLFYVALAICILISKNVLALAALLFTFLGSLSSVRYFQEFYYLKYYLLEFSFGILIGYFINNGIKIEKSIGALLLTISFILFIFNNYFVSEGFIAWGFPSIMLVLGCYAFEGAGIFKCKSLQVLGDASYSIYLIHPFFIWAFERNYAYGNSVFAVMIAVFLSIIVGIICFRLVEKPLLNYMLRYVNKRKRLQLV